MNCAQVLRPKNDTRSAATIEQCAVQDNGSLCWLWQSHDQTCSDWNLSGNQLLEQRLNTTQETSRSRHSQGSKDPHRQCHFVPHDLDLWPFKPKINGFPGVTVDHVQVKFGDPSWIGFWDSCGTTDRQTNQQTQMLWVTTINLSCDIHTSLSFLQNYTLKLPASTQVWRRGVVVTALVVSTKLLYVEPG